MNTLIAIILRIKATLFGGSIEAQTVRPAPARAKLAGRNGYGSDDTPPPS